MVDPAKIEAAIAGHADTDHVAVPVSMLKEIAAFYRGRAAGRAQLAAASTIGDICGSLMR